MAPVEQFAETANQILEGRYDSAEAVADSFMAEQPCEPSGPLMKAAVIHYRNIDYEDTTRSADYFALLEHAERLAAQKTEENRDDIWARYFLASAWILKGAWTAANGGFLSGILTARTGVRGMEDVLADDNSCHDAYLSVGAYRFWKSEATKSLHWLPLIGDDRERGIEEVKHALDRGIMSTPLTSTVLIEMLIAYDPVRAASLADELASKHPACRLFRWQLGEAYKRSGDYDGAVRVYSRLAEEMAEDPMDDGSGPLRCWWKLAVIAEAAGKRDDCRRYCEDVLALGQQPEVYNRQQKRIGEAKKLLERVR
jgi:tetratricopeptide (TPR) repeat protein